MKTKIYFLITLFFLTLFSCDDSVSAAYSNSDFNLMPKNLSDYCNTTESLYKKSSKYNTETGEALLHLVIPKGHFVKMSKQTKTEITFATFGKKFDNSYEIISVYVKGLAQTEGQVLTVYLEIDPKSEDNCGVNTKGQKKKTSTVDGEPIAGSLIN